MGISRKDLIEALQVVAPTLGTKDYHPPLKYFWFDGETVLAYDDVIAISHPCPFPFEGGVLGSQLLRTLQSVQGRSIEVIGFDVDELELKIGTTTVQVPAMGPDQRPVAEFPKTEGWSSLPITADLLDGLRFCLPTTVADTSLPDQTGITVLRGKHWALYSTNEETMCRYVLDDEVREATADRYLVPASFCTQFASIATGKYEVLKFDAGTRNIVAELNSGTRVFGRLINLEGDEPVNYAGMCDLLDELIERRGLFAIPDRFRLHIERLARSGNPDDRWQHQAQFQVKTGRLTIARDGPTQFRSSAIDLPGHPDVSARFNPKHLWPMMKGFQQMLVTPDAFVMGKAKRLFVASAAERIRRVEGTPD